MTQPNTIQEVIKNQLSNQPQGYTVRQLSDILGYTSSQDFKEFVKAIAEAEADGQIILGKDGKFRAKRTSSTITGVFRANDRGFGFVTYDPAEEDIYISKEHTSSAMEGDQVEVAITNKPEPWNNKGPEGKIVSILERNTERVVGEFFPYDQTKREETGFVGYVIPQDKKINRMVVSILPEGLKPVEGSIALVEITEYPSAENPVAMKGLIVKELGHKNAPGVDILSILYKIGIPTEFPTDVLEQTETVPVEIAESELEGRRDLRDKMIITIDGADAKDLDDAISFEPLNNGNVLLGVHIADVSHYVTENSPIDREAYVRGTSVYVTDRVVPMLPQKLSNGVCSLLPNEDRLTMTCSMEMDPSGKVVNYEIYPSVIRSKQRFTYDNVNRILDDRDVSTRKEFEAYVGMLEAMKKLHRALEKRRKQRGSIDFDTSESKIVVDEKGAPLDIVVVNRGVGERLIESFMLVANETVAAHFTKRKLPFIYRVHEQPDPAKMLRFMEFVTTFGIMVRGSNENIKPLQLQQILRQTESEPYHAVVSTVLLRSLKQAKYDTDPLGHYGLATKDYTHFTSPIRRYPDLIVHRLIRAYTMNGEGQAQKEKWAAKLPDIAVQSSVTERRAVEAERETEALKKTEFMVDKVGMEFEGVISSVTKFGIFVELPNTIEGLVHISNMDKDYFNFIESHMVLLGERTGIVYRIGQKVRIKVTKANVDTREIDFELIDDKDLAVYDEAMRQATKKSSRKKDHHSSKKPKPGRRTKKPDQKPRTKLKKRK